MPVIDASDGRKIILFLGEAGLTVRVYLGAQEADEDEFIHITAQPHHTQLGRRPGYERQIGWATAIERPGPHEPELALDYEVSREQDATHILIGNDPFSPPDYQVDVSLFDGWQDDQAAWGGAHPPVTIRLTKLARDGSVVIFERVVHLTDLPSDDVNRQRDIPVATTPTNSPNGVQVEWRSERSVFFSSPQANLAGFLTLARQPGVLPTPTYNALQAEFYSLLHATEGPTVMGRPVIRHVPLHSLNAQEGHMLIHSGPETEHIPRVYIHGHAGAVTYLVEINHRPITDNETDLLITVSNPHDDELVSQCLVSEADVRNGRHIRETQRDLRVRDSDPRATTPRPPATETTSPVPRWETDGGDPVWNHSLPPTAPYEWLPISTNNARRYTQKTMKIAKTIIDDLHTADQFLRENAAIRDYLNRYESDQPMHLGVALDILLNAYDRRRNGE